MTTRLPRIAVSVALLLCLTAVYLAERIPLVAGNHTAAVAPCTES